MRKAECRDGVTRRVIKAGTFTTKTVSPGIQQPSYGKLGPGWRIFFHPSDVLGLADWISLNAPASGHPGNELDLDGDDKILLSIHQDIFERFVLFLAATHDLDIVEIEIASPEVVGYEFVSRDNHVGETQGHLRRNRARRLQGGSRGA